VEAWPANTKTTAFATSPLGVASNVRTRRPGAEPLPLLVPPQEMETPKNDMFTKVPSHRTECQTGGAVANVPGQKTLTIEENTVHGLSFLAFTTFLAFKPVQVPIPFTAMKPNAILDDYATHHIDRKPCKSVLQ